LKLLVIGFDAVGAESVIPNAPRCFEGLMKEHLYGALQSTKLAHTIPALFSIYEGVDRSEDWRGKLTWNTSWDEAKHPLIFDLLATADIKMGLVSLPMTTPVRPYDCFVLGGWMADQKSRKKNNKKVYYPDEIQCLIKEHKGCILRELGVDRYIELNDSPRQALIIGENLALSRAENIITLGKLCKPDLGFVYFDFTDRLAHLIPRTSSLVKSAIGFCDRLTSEIVNALNPEHILIFSDHGWGFKGESKQARTYTENGWVIREAPVEYHGPTGFYIYTGGKGGMKNASILDIAPTILNEFNISIPSYFGGRPLCELS